MKKKTTKAAVPKIKIGAFLGRFHAIIFTVVVGGEVMHNQKFSESQFRN